VKTFNCDLSTIIGRFLTRLSFKEKKCVIYNLVGTQFCGKPSFSGKQIAIKIYANLGLASSGFEQLGPYEQLRIWSDMKL